MHDARRAIEDGFTASARVVVAAALIMFAVFAAFVPESEGPIKTISFGLAVGVAIDAFAVRMTLVPAFWRCSAGGPGGCLGGWTGGCPRLMSKERAWRTRSACPTGRRRTMIILSRCQGFGCDRPDEISISLRSGSASGRGTAQIWQERVVAHPGRMPVGGEV